MMKKTSGGSRYDLALVAAFQQRAHDHLFSDRWHAVHHSERNVPNEVPV